MHDRAYRLGDQPLLKERSTEDTAIVHGKHRVSFAQLNDRAHQFASGVQASGLGVGHRLLLLTPNRPEVFEVLIGAARVGVVVVPMNWRLSPNELLDIAIEAQADGIVVDPSLAHLVADVIPQLDPRLVITLGVEFEAWLRRPWPEPVPVAAAADTVVLQIYTSGTSGRPKAVLITNQNLSAKVVGVAPRWGLGADSTTLLVTPLFHVGALSWGLTGLNAAATTRLADDATAATLARHLRVDGITHAFLVPVMFPGLCKALGPRVDLPALRLIVYGASPITLQVQADAMRTFGSRLRQLYGMSEPTGAFTEMPIDPNLAQNERALQSVGRPYPWVDVEIHDPATGQRLSDGIVGEVWTRSDQTTIGYMGQPGPTGNLLTPEGWLRTGDGGYLSTDGLLFLTDRIKDLIISGGENVLPTEVEDVLASHPDVAESAVFGVPDARWGETVAAAVVCRFGSKVDAEDLLRFAADRLAGYKRPRRILFVEDLPRNASGKIIRRDPQEATT